MINTQISLSLPWDGSFETQSISVQTQKIVVAKASRPKGKPQQRKLPPIMCTFIRVCPEWLWGSLSGSSPHAMEYWAAAGIRRLERVGRGDGFKSGPCPGPNA